MSDILIPVEPSVKVMIREVDGSIREVSQHSEHLTAFKAVNRLNFAHGIRKGTYYFIEGEN